ncbi:hypothetical protein [Tenacibaculum maritimum]|uniref:hypothetical protein n=1 Tax=Tenacibaculum maritimum TaxID=107401 RepID=UPI00388DB901
MFTKNFQKVLVLLVLSLIMFSCNDDINNDVVEVQRRASSSGIVSVNAHPSSLSWLSPDNTIPYSDLEALDLANLSLLIFDAKDFSKEDLKGIVTKYQDRIPVLLDFSGSQYDITGISEVLGASVGKGAYVKFRGKLTSYSLEELKSYNKQQSLSEVKEVFNITEKVDHLELLKQSKTFEEFKSKLPEEEIGSEGVKNVTEQDWLLIKEEIIERERLTLEEEQKVGNKIPSLQEVFLRDLASQRATVINRSRSAATSSVPQLTMEAKLFFYIDSNEKQVKGAPTDDYFKLSFQVTYEIKATRLAKITKGQRSNYVEISDGGIGMTPNVFQGVWGNYFSYVVNSIWNVPSNITYSIAPVRSSPSKGTFISKYAPSNAADSSISVSESSGFSIGLPGDAIQIPNFTLSFGKTISYAQDKTSTSVVTSPVDGSISWTHDYNKFNNLLTASASKDESFFKVNEFLGFSRSTKYNGMYSLSELPSMFKNSLPAEHSVVYKVENDKKSVFRLSLGVDLSSISKVWTGLFWDLPIRSAITKGTKRHTLNRKVKIYWEGIN